MTTSLYAYINAFMPVSFRAGDIVASSHFCQQLSVGKKSKTDQQSNRISTSKAMARCHKEYAKVCEIRVRVDAPPPRNPRLYQRIRFGLLASSWLPSPLGIFLWSALHVMLLILYGPAYWVLGLLTAFLYSVIMLGLLGILYCYWFLLFGMIAVVFDLVRLLVQSIRFCWALVGLMACHEPSFKRRGCACWTAEFWKGFRCGIEEISEAGIPIGVPCMSESFYQKTKNRKLRIWARWCQEVVHMHDAIAL